MEPTNEPASGPGLHLAMIGGVPVTRQEIVEAIDVLEESTGTWILPRLIEISSPLARTDYKGLADRYQREHPEDNLPKAEPGTHPARRRIAFIHLLQRQRDDLDRQSGSPVNKEIASDAEQVQQEEAAEPLSLNDEDGPQACLRRDCQARGPARLQVGVDQGILWPLRSNGLRRDTRARSRTSSPLPRSRLERGELETSILLHAYPEIVRTGYEVADHIADDRTGLLTLSMEHYTESGIIGRPSLASATKGKAVLASLVNSFADCLQMIADKP